MHIERTPSNDGASIDYSLPGNIRFSLRNLENAHVEARTAFETSLDTVASTTVQAGEIAADARLSAIGREEKLTPLYATAVSHLAGAWWQVNQLERTVVSQEAALLKVPDLDPTHAACAIEDREVRDYFRSLDPSKRLQMIAEMHKDPAAHQRIQIAMLRSPIALLEQEARLLREVWTEAKRAANPADAAAIDQGRESVDWGKRALSTLGALFKVTARLKEDQLLRTILLDANPRRACGYGVFGIGEGAVHLEAQRLYAAGYRKDAEGLWRKAT